MNFKLAVLDFDATRQVSLLDYTPSIYQLPDNLEKWNQTGDSSEIFYTTGFEIRLERNIQKYIMNYYMPSGLMVTVSWVSF